MIDYQLRIYRVRDGRMDDFVREWRERILPLRERHGFTVLGPWVIEAENRFVWIVGREDFEAADKTYYASPERTALEPDPARHLAEVEVHPLQAV